MYRVNLGASGIVYLNTIDDEEDVRMRQEAVRSPEIVF